MTDSELAQVAKAPVDADAETARKVMRLMEALDDHDDVQNVYSHEHDRRVDGGGGEGVSGGPVR